MSSLYRVNNPPALPERFIPPGLDLNELSSDFYDAEKQYKLGIEHSKETLYGDAEEAEKKAFLCFQNAAFFGHADAAYELGLSYLVGRAVNESAEKAQRCFLHAAAKKSAKAFYILGRLCEEKLGLGQSDREALGYFMMAGDLGHIKALLRSGEIYEQGLGVEPSLSDAFYWYEKAAKTAEMYASGQGSASFQNKWLSNE